MSGERGKVVVVGAGIVGAACAEAFAREGFDVVIVEAQTIGGGATAAGMGHLVVLDDSEAEFALSDYSVRLWRELKPRLPASTEIALTGTVWVAADAEEMAEVQRKHAVAARRGLATEVLDGPALAECEPNLRPGLAGGLLVTGDGVVYAPTVAAWLVEQARQRGAILQLGIGATEIKGKRVTLADGTTYWADLVVNATGAWAPRFTPGVKIRPRKGHLVITDRYPGFVRHQLVELGYLKSAHGSDADSVAFNAQPRATGQILIGSSRQFADESKEIDHAILGRMIRRAIEYLPGLTQLSAIRVWTGTRATTPDKLPLIGPVPWDEGLYLATGHEGLGITTSLGTARLLVDHVLGRETAMPIEPYLPTRFLGVASHG